MDSILYLKSLQVSSYPDPWGMDSQSLWSLASCIFEIVLIAEIPIFVPMMSTRAARKSLISLTPVRCDVGH